MSNLFLCTVRDRDLTSIFYVWIVFLEPFVKKVSLMFVLDPFVGNEMVYLCGFVSGLSSPSIYMSFCASTILFLLLRFCSVICNQVLGCQQHCPLAKDFFGYSGSFVFPCEF